MRLLSNVSAFTTRSPPTVSLAPRSTVTSVTVFITLTASATVIPLIGLGAATTSTVLWVVARRVRSSVVSIFPATSTVAVVLTTPSAAPTR